MAYEDFQNVGYALALILVMVLVIFVIEEVQTLGYKFMSNRYNLLMVVVLCSFIVFDAVEVTFEVQSVLKQEDFTLVGILASLGIGISSFGYFIIIRLRSAPIIAQLSDRWQRIIQVCYYIALVSLCMICLAGILFSITHNDVLYLIRKVFILSAGTFVVVVDMLYTYAFWKYLKDISGAVQSPHVEIYKVISSSGLQATLFSQAGCLFAAIASLTTSLTVLAVSIVLCMISLTSLYISLVYMKYRIVWKQSEIATRKQTTIQSQVKSQVLSQMV